jgi:hypothetical protein
MSDNAGRGVRGNFGRRDIGCRLYFFARPYLAVTVLVSVPSDKLASDG